MKRILILLAMLFVTFLNLRVLFCEQEVNLNTEFNVYDAFVGIKNQLFSSEPTTTALETNIEATAETKMLKGNVYEQELDRVMASFKNSKSWNETSIQQLINLLDMDMKLVKMLMQGKQNQEMTATIKQRDEMLRQTVPTIAQVYNRIMDVATYDAKLEPQTYKNKKGETIARSGYLTSREKKRYLRNIEKSLRSMARNLAVEQDQISMVNAMKHSNVFKKVMSPTVQNTKKAINTAIDAQDVSVKSSKKMNKRISKKMTNKNTCTLQPAEAQEMMKTCTMLKKVLEKYVGTCK
jgi:hypothetical protein